MLVADVIKKDENDRSLIWIINYTSWKNINTKIRKIPKDTFEANSIITSESSFFF
jgi:hypothetical protein